MTYFRANKNQNRLSSNCPECTKPLVIASVDGDSKHYKCNYCRSEVTVTKSKKKTKAKKVKDGIIIRDRSNERPTSVDKENKNESPKKEASEIDEDTLVAKLKKSLENTQLVTITYQSKKGESTRTIEPYQLVKDKNGDLCLYGYCLNSKGIRHFKLKNLQDAIFEDTKYEARWPIEVNI